jgi:hypothetical protein
MLMKLGIWLCDIHFEATSDPIPQGSAYLGHDVACWQIPDCYIHMLVNQFIAVGVSTLTKVLAAE